MTRNILAFAPAPTAPAKRQPRAATTRAKPDTKNLLFRSGTWYMRRMQDGKARALSLRTSDLTTARKRRDEHLGLTSRGAYSWSATDAANHAARIAKASTIEEARPHFIASRDALGLRPDTVRSYEHIHALFAKAFPGNLWHRLTPADFNAWLIARYPNRTSAATIARTLRTLFTWALDAHILRNPALAAFKYRAPLEDKSIDFLTVDEANTLVVSAYFTGCIDDLAALALGLFAGIRPEEINRLRWSAVNFEEKRITIPESVAKNRRKRVIEDLPETVWRHLAHFADRAPTERITAHYAEALRRIRTRAKLDRWPHDAIRRSFASYHVALTSDLNRTSIILGHTNPVTLATHYNGAAAKADAVKFFAL